MLRRLAISLAATSALVLTATAPALADHGPEPDLELPDNPTCADIPDTDFETLGSKVDPPVDVDNDFYASDVSDDGVFLDVTAKEGFVIDAVIVKGSDSANVFLGPATSFEHLFSPIAGGSGEPAEISHYEVCGKEEPPPDDEEPPGDDEEPPADDEEPPADDEEVKDEKTPAAVPTEVPAGLSGSGDGGSMAPVGIAAVALMMLAGGAALLRRRFGHQS